MTGLALDGALLLVGGAILWEVASRSLLLVALAVATCLVGGAVALARLATARRQALASATACCALAASVLLSTTRLWSPDLSVASVLVLLAATGVALSAARRRAADPRWVIAVVATTLVVGPAWAVWGGDDAVSVPNAVRLLAVAVALGALPSSSRPWWSLGMPLGTVIAAVAGLPRVDLRAVELLAVSMVGLLTLLRWWRVVAPRPRTGGVPDPHGGSSRVSMTAVVGMLVMVGWLCAVADGWRAVAVVSAGTVVLTASGACDRGATTWEGDRRRRSLERVAVEVARRSQIDALTGLPNRDAFDRRLAEEIERAVRYQQPVAVCFVDIDHFKAVNDEYGHDVGDQVLVGVAESLRSSSRTVDVVCRYGGEEFAVIAPGTWTSDAVVLAERLRRRVTMLRPVELQWPLTVSVGVAGLPEHASDGRSLLRRADDALYDAKRSGRDRTSIAPAAAVTGQG